MNQLEYDICLRVYRGEQDIEQHATPEENAILSACRKQRWLGVSETGNHWVTQLGRAAMLAYCDALQEQSYQQYLDDEKHHHQTALAAKESRKSFCRELVVASLGGIIGSLFTILIQNLGKALDFLKLVCKNWHL